MNHCGYFEIYLKAKSLRKLHTRNRKDKCRHVLLLFSVRLISFTLSARDFSCAVFGFGSSLYSDPPEELFPRSLRPAVDPEASPSHSIAAWFSVLVQVFIVICPKSFFARPLRPVVDPEARPSHSNVAREKKILVPRVA